MITSEEINKEFLELGHIETVSDTYRTHRDEYSFTINEGVCILRVWTLQGEVRIDRINGLFINKIEDLKFIMTNIV